MLYNDLKTIADSLNTPNKFVYYNPSNANAEAGEVLPGEIFIVLDSPTVINGNISRSMVFRDVLSLRLFFFSNYSEDLDYHTQTDDNSEQRDNIQNKTLGVAKEFLLRYIKEFPYMDESTGSLESISYSFESVEFEFNANMHGVRLDVSLPVVLPFDYCLTPPPPPYEPQIEYTNLLNYWVNESFPIPTEEKQLVQDTLIKELKESGLWDLLKCFFVFAGNSKETSLTDWKRLTQATELNNALTSETYQYLQGDITQNSFIANFNEIDYPELLDNISYSFFHVETPIINNNSSFVFGPTFVDGNTLSLSASTQRKVFNVNPVNEYYIQDISQIQISSNLLNESMYILNRFNGEIDIIENTTPILNTLSPSQPLSNTGVSVFGGDASVGGSPSNAKLSIFAIGENMKDKAAQFETIIRKYLTDIIV